LEEVVLHQVGGERDLAHAELLAVLLGVMHAVGLQNVQGFQVWVKGVPVKSRESSLSEEGMELGKQQMALRGFQKEVIVRILGGRDSTGKPLHLRMDNLLMGLANQGRQIQVNDANTVIPGAHLEGTPGGKGCWEVLRDPNAIDWGFTTGSMPEGG